MKKKKLAAVMLCLLLTGALAGCGQDAGSTAEVTGGTAFTEDTADTQTTDAAQDMQAADDSGMHAGDLPAAGAGDVQHPVWPRDHDAPPPARLCAAGVSRLLLCGL